ncbi:MAG: N(G),N(G)-dimethylarginine dimethylaminohydrolase [Acidobacteriia bacterium]|nr:N(G),N(G)-dimethylarginine dimethylaminohydrolase [Terriglobia bacterium]
MFKNAVVRPPAANFAAGLTTADLGAPIYAKALEQHRRYCEALQHCGLALTKLEADPHYPDSTFVEDTAILTDRFAILTRPGAVSRRGEVATIKDTLARFYPKLHAIISPGTVDGGDICEAGDHFFIGISQRTNKEGARQLAGILAQEGYTSTCIDIRRIKGILHLKSGLSHLGDNRLVLIGALADQAGLAGYDIVHVEPSENYAANCVQVNEVVLLAAGYPALQSSLIQLGYSVITLEMSEFQKMDGGLSCLSLRF